MIKVWLVGYAQIAFQRFPEDISSTYMYYSIKSALKEKFEPPCRKDQYQVQLQTHKKKKKE